MVVVGRIERADDGEIINTTADLGPPVAHLDATLASLRESDLKRIELVPDVPIRVVFDGDTDVLGEGRIKHALMRGFLDCFARVAVQLGLRVEAFQVARAADHEQPDHSLRPRSECGNPSGGAHAPASPARARPSRKSMAPMCQPRETHAQVGEGTSRSPRRRQIDELAILRDDLARRHRIVEKVGVVHQHVYKVFPSPLLRIGRGAVPLSGPLSKGVSFARIVQLLPLRRR